MKIIPLAVPTPFAVGDVNVDMSGDSAAREEFALGIDLHHAERLRVLDPRARERDVQHTAAGSAS